MVTVQDKHFVIRGEKTFLYGAECHYFRLDPNNWEDRLRKIRNAGFNLVSTYVPWIWHAPSEDVTDLTGATHPRRNLIRFLDLCRSLNLFCIVRPGPYVMSELKNEGIPHWLLNQYPEVIARTRHGEFHPTRVVSYMHPTFLNKVEVWYRDVNQQIRSYLETNGGPLIMYQLDNEVGMLHWVTNVSDYNEATLAHFGHFLKKRYESLAAANEDFGMSASSVDEIVRQFADERYQETLSVHWIWGEFWREYIASYIGTLGEMARRQHIDVPFIVNVHGFKDYSMYSRGVDYPIGLSQLRNTAFLDDVVIAGDFYPGRIGYDNYHDLVLSSAFTEAISRPDQPLFSAEFQSGRLSDRPRVYPQDIDLITRICVANGMNALNYYMFCGGDNVEDIGLFGRRHEWQAPIAANGDLRPSYQTSVHLGKLFQALGSRLCDYRKVVDTHVAFYSPYYMTETVRRDNPQTQRVIQDIEGQREHLHFDGLWRVLVAANISFAAVDLTETVDLSPVELPTLWVAATQYMDADTQGKLVAYLHGGGRLVLGPRLPDKDLSGEPCRILADAIGLSKWSEKSGYLRVNVLDMDSVFCRQHLVLDATEVEENEVMAWGEDRAPAGIIRPVGSGVAMVLGVAVNHDFQYGLTLIRQLAGTLGITPMLDASDENVFVVERRGRDGAILFLNNADDIDRTTVLYRDGRPAFDGQAVHVRARSGLMLPVDMAVTDELQIDYSTVELVDLREGANAISLVFHIPASVQGHLRFTARGGLTLGNISMDKAVIQADGDVVDVTLPERNLPESVTVVFARVTTGTRV